MALGDVVYEKVIDFAVTTSVTTTLFGTGISAAYESVSKTLQASIGNQQGGVIFSGEPTCQELDAECELTLKIVSDSAGRKHTGGWLVTPTGTQANGYRFFALDSLFGISKWTSGVESTTANTAGGLVVGQSYRVKFTKVGTNLTLYVDDVQVMQSSDGDHFDLRPALFLYGCTVQVSKVIWRHLDSVLVNVDIRNHHMRFTPANQEPRSVFQPQDVAWVGGEGKGYAGPVNTNQLDLSLLCAGLDRYWLRDGVQNVLQGYIESTVTINGEGVARRVLCFDQAGNLVGETMSRASDGKYRFDLLWLNRRYMLVAQDDPAFGPADYNAVAADFQLPTPYAPGEGVGLA